MKAHVVVALVLPWLASACAEFSTGPSSSAPLPRPILEDDDPWTMIPAEADLVLWADMAKLRTSPWTRDSFAKIAPQDMPRSEPAFEQMNNLERVLFAKVPALRDGASVLVGQGPFDREAMRQAFVQKAGPVETSGYRGAELNVRGDEALAFLGRRTVLSGLTVAVRAALDCNIGVARSIESESWLQRLRGDLGRDKGGTAPVTALYVRLQPATREALMREMGEGGDLEEFGGRVDLAADLTMDTIGVTRTEQQASDLAARLSERVLEVRGRPIVAAFGFGSVLDSMRLHAEGTRVYGNLRVSERERVLIALKMAIVADTLARMRRERTLEPQQP